MKGNTLGNDVLRPPFAYKIRGATWEFSPHIQTTSPSTTLYSQPPKRLEPCHGILLFTSSYSFPHHEGKDGIQESVEATRSRSRRRRVQSCPFEPKHHPRGEETRKAGASPYGGFCFLHLFRSTWIMNRTDACSLPFAGPRKRSPRSSDDQDQAIPWNKEHAPAREICPFLRGLEDSSP